MDKELDRWICDRFKISYRPLDYLELMRLWLLLPEPRFPTSVLRRKNVLYARMIIEGSVKYHGWKITQDLCGFSQVWTRWGDYRNMWERPNTMTTEKQLYISVISAIASLNFKTLKQVKHTWNESRRTLSNGDRRQ